MTRARLIEATKDVLADAGRSGLSLRTVSAAAGTNIAAVKYHFGSRDALIDEVLEDLIGQLTARQIAALDALACSDRCGDVRSWVIAWAGPLIEVIVSDTPENRRLGRIIGRALGDRVDLAPQVRALVGDADKRLVRGLAQALAPIADAEVWLRVTVMASALAGLAGDAFTPMLQRAATAEPLRERLIDVLEPLACGPLT
ncbi:AcrR family transcriptional regulator [Streptomyces sp. SAI-135]|jgi:AcrR family transcriptional regulator|nr:MULTISPECIES: TetR/AcrR family transcriptional regulator [unclassified Streptomyces]MDH6554380.1 AcrR family transcriptional regulator [Streptomyces sp. SAI-041]MDH6573645.1 AcrR family transcriptional regulator [Streptomyces sp. SAI-117]MDH6581621.1 AcrR family transcriptional regulator [Streptomyces sp. SAI-133]MDH6613627.1 AcrR family transcriptional regulator [Streptomyces sp. SAI-135]